MATFYTSVYHQLAVQCYIVQRQATIRQHLPSSLLIFGSHYYITGRPFCLSINFNPNLAQYLTFTFTISSLEVLIFEYVLMYDLNSFIGSHTDLHMVQLNILICRREKFGQIKSFSDLMLGVEGRKFLFQQVLPIELFPIVTKNNFLVSNHSKVPNCFFFQYF